MKNLHDKSRETSIIPNNQQQERVSLFKRLSRTRNSRAFKAFTSALAIIIVFGTTYSLIMPAITVDQESAEEMPGIYLEDDTGAYDADDPDMYEDTYEDMSADADEIGNEPDNQDASYIEGDDWEADGQTYYDNTPDVEDYDDEWSDDDYTDNAAEDEESQPFGENNDLVDQADNENAAAASSYTFDENRMETMLPAETALLGDVTVRIDYNSAALIPDGSIFNAEEVNTWAETEEELEYKEWRLENLKDTADALLTDMDSDWSYHDAAFIDTELIDPEGNPEQPESDLYLTINFTNPLYTDKVEFVQFLYDAGTDSEYPVILNPVDLGYTEDGGLFAGVFMVDTISAFGVVCGDSLLALEEAQEEDSISAISEMEYPEGEEDIAAEEEPVEEEISVQSAAETVAVESEAEFAVEPSLAESELGSTAEPVLVESEADSIAEPVLTESETDSAAEAVLTDSFAEPVLDLALLYPAQAFNGSTDEVTVTVRAPEGAFPAGTAMILKGAINRTVNNVADTISDDTTVFKGICG